MLMRYTIFKQRKPKEFGFKGRYYDTDKEELKARIESVKRELDNDIEPESSAFGGESLRQKMRANRSHYSQTSTLRKKSNIRVLIIAGILGLIVMYLLY